MVKQKIVDAIKCKFGFLTRAQNTILSAATIIALASGINAVLGIIKSRLLSAYFGTSSDLTIFFTADKIPSLLYSLFVVGALSTVFIPIYTEAKKESDEKSQDIASVIITVGTLLFIVIGSCAFIFADNLIKILSVSQFTPAEIQKGALLLKLMLGAQIILLVSSFLTGLLQSHRCFLLTSLAPLLYNLGLIAGIIVFSNKHGILGPTYGIMIGALAHLAIQLPGVVSIKYKYTFLLKLKDEYLRRFFKLVPPRILSILIANGLNMINNSLAILISKPAAIYLKFAGQLQFFPVNLFAISIASAALPTLSRQATIKNKDRFKKILITSLHQMLFLVIPCSVILMVLRIPLIRLAYGTSKFPWEATVKTSYTLAFYSISIFAQGTIYLLNRAYYALKDTKTPVKVSLVTVILNVGLSVLFTRKLNLGVWSIALSYSITSIIDMLALLYLLAKKLGGFDLKGTVVPFIKMSWAATIMGISIYAPLKLLDRFVFDSTRTIQLLLITMVTSLVGMGTYLLFNKIFKVKEMELFGELIQKINLKKIIKKSNVASEITEIEY